jgi:hypothetical protein
MSDDFTKEQGTALWHQAMAVAQPLPAGRPVSALDLAAWLDGGTDEALAARVEAALAADPALLAMALALSPAGSGESELDAEAAATERLVVRARALVAPPVRGAAGNPARGGGWMGSLFRWRRSAEWAMVGVSMMVAAAAGLWIGGDVGDSLASQTVSLSLFGDDGNYGGLLSSTEDL